MHVNHSLIVIVFTLLSILMILLGNLFHSFRTLFSTYYRHLLLEDTFPAVFIGPVIPCLLNLFLCLLLSENKQPLGLGMGMSRVWHDDDDDENRTLTGLS